MSNYLNDKRISYIGILKSDMPPAYPGGSSHKAGTPVYPTCLVQTSDGRNIGFILPSAVSLALNIALQAIKDSKKLYSMIEFEKVQTPKGDGFSVSKQTTSILYDYFEACMKITIFSFQAIEVFCNHTIIREANDKFEYKRKSQVYYYSKEELERNLSTDEKLSIILPQLKKIKSPKGTKLWENFKKLKVTRDSIIHLKAKDQQAIDKDSLYFQFLNGDISEFPKTAILVIQYFSKLEKWTKLLDECD